MAVGAEHIALCDFFQNPLSTPTLVYHKGNRDFLLGPIAVMEIEAGNVRFTALRTPKLSLECLQPLPRRPTPTSYTRLRTLLVSFVPDAPITTHAANVLDSPLLCCYRQARQESNLQPLVLETSALPIELRTFVRLPRASLRHAGVPARCNPGPSTAGRPHRGPGRVGSRG